MMSTSVLAPYLLKAAYELAWQRQQTPDTLHVLEAPLVNPNLAGAAHTVYSTLSREQRRWWSFLIKYELTAHPPQIAVDENKSLRLRNIEHRLSSDRQSLGAWQSSEQTSVRLLLEILRDDPLHRVMMTFCQINQDEFIHGLELAQPPDTPIMPIMPIMPEGDVPGRGNMLGLPAMPSIPIGRDDYGTYAPPTIPRTPPRSYPTSPELMTPGHVPIWFPEKSAAESEHDDAELRKQLPQLITPMSPTAGHVYFKLHEWEASQFFPTLARSMISQEIPILAGHLGSPIHMMGKVLADHLGLPPNQEPRTELRNFTHIYQVNTGALLQQESDAVRLLQLILQQAAAQHAAVMLDHLEHLRGSELAKPLLDRFAKHGNVAVFGVYYLADDEQYDPTSIGLDHPYTSPIPISDYSLERTADLLERYYLRLWSETYRYKFHTGQKAFDWIFKLQPGVLVATRRPDGKIHYMHKHLPYLAVDIGESTINAFYLGEDVVRYTALGALDAIRRLKDQVNPNFKDLLRKAEDEIRQLPLLKPNSGKGLPNEITRAYLAAQLLCPTSEMTFQLANGEPGQTR